MTGPSLASLVFAVGACLLTPSAALADVDAKLAVARENAHKTYGVCTKDATKAKILQAGDAHRSAKAALARADYAEAIRQWTVAYGFDCTRPTVFINLANSYEHSDPAMAVALLELYLERDPKADHADISAHIQSDMSSLKAGASDSSGKLPFQLDEWVTKPTNEGTVRPYGAIPWVLVGIGAAAIAGGTPVLIVGRLKVGDAVDRCGGHTGCTADEISTGTTGNTMTGVGVATASTGGALLIAGLIWQFAGNGPRPAAAHATNDLAPRDLQLFPVVEQSQAGLRLTGRF